MAQYTLREWERLPYGDGPGQIPALHADQMAALAATSPFAGRGGQGVLEHGRHAIRARGVVGVLAGRDCSLEILPKIDTFPGASAEAQYGVIRQRLVHMLSVALDLKLDPGQVTELAWQRETMLEILIRLFCGQLTEAVRRGMPRNYVGREDDLPALRGALDPVRQFTRHAANPARLACRFDELSPDIALNRIIKAATRHLLRLSRSATNRARLQELAFVYAGIADVPLVSLPWSEVTIDRTNRRWRDVLAMARLFLEQRYQTTSGGAGQGTALLFEMNALFEEYVGRLIRRALSGSDCSVTLQGGRLFCLSAGGRGLFQTKPDILIRQGGAVIHVIDTKWKRISSRIDDPKQGVSQADVYQMMAYAQLYGAPRVTLLYPHHVGLESAAGLQGVCQITGREEQLQMATLDLSSAEQPAYSLARLFTTEQKCLTISV